MSFTDATTPAVVLDVQALQNPMHRDRGIGRYVVAHVDALLDVGAPVAALTLNPDHPAPPSLPYRWLDAGLVRWNEPSLARELSERGFVYHVMSPFEPAVPEDGVVAPHMLEASDALVVTLYDAIPFVFPEWYQRDDSSRSFYRRRAELLRVADAVLAISWHTRRDAIQRLTLTPPRVHYIGSGPAPRDDTAGPSTTASGVQRPFVLTVTGWGEPRKNPSSLFAAYAALPAPVRAAHQLVVVCDLPDEGRAAWNRELRALGLGDDEVVLTGRVEQATLDALYEQAQLFVFTSRYEGFGLPALEAAVAGAPVLTTDVSSLPEVIDHDLARVADGDADALARRMATVLTDATVREELREASVRAAQRHTWPAVARRTIDAYGAAVLRAATVRGRIATRAPALRPRLALAGPYPPSKSGIAEWSERLVHALRPHADVDVFREGAPRLPARPDPSPQEHAAGRNRRFPIDAFGRVLGAGAYDMPIYTIGNGYHHRHTLDAALAAPGIVWLHESRLAGLYLTRAGLFHPGIEPVPAEIERARRTMAEAVTRMHDGAQPLGDDDWWRTEAYDERGYSFLADVVASARGVIVSTERAAADVRAHTRPGVAVHVLPLPFPERSVRRNELDGHGARDDDPDRSAWIVSFGWVDPIKQPDVLLRSVASVAAHGRNVQLAFVGELAPATRADLDARAAELGVADRLTYTGFVTREQYDGWLTRATIAVQLRSTSRGEASAALHDAIGAGIPTITNIPTAGELPHDAVVHLDAHGTALDGALTDAIEDLLRDADRRNAVARAARRHADAWRFDDLAARLLDIVRATPRAAVATAHAHR